MPGPFGPFALSPPLPSPVALFGPALVRSSSSSFSSPIPNLLPTSCFLNFSQPKMNLAEKAAAVRDSIAGAAANAGQAVGRYWH